MTKNFEIYHPNSDLSGNSAKMNTNISDSRVHFKNFDQNNNPEQISVTIENPNRSTEAEKKAGFFARLFSRKIDDARNNEIDIAKEVNFKEHLFTLAELEVKLGTSLTTGLTQAEAAFRLKRDGPNAFSPPKVTAWWIELLNEMLTGFALLFWFAGIASVVCYPFDGHNPQDYYLAIILFVVVIGSGTWSWLQKQSSGKIFDTFKKMTPQSTTVLRDGQQRTIEAINLVVGDVVFIKGGERVPADVRIVHCEGMKVDNSSLTGECEPLSRSPDAGIQSHQSPLEAKNLAFSSTNCVDGSGHGVVLAVGDSTVMGKIAKLVTNLQAGESPISKEIYRFVVFIAISSVVEGVIFFAVCMGLRMNIFTSLIFTIGIITGNIPECVLPAVTVSLTLTAKLLASKNCMIKFLEAVEILGSTSIICSDKTGTLTENRMTVEHCYLGNRIWPVTHDHDEVNADMAGIVDCWEMFQRCAKLCSRAVFTTREPDIMKRSCSGDASETGILRFMESISTESVEEYRRRYPKVAEKPFSSVYKYQYSVHSYPKATMNSATFFVVMKGAPERIVHVCSRILDAKGITRSLTDEDVERFEEAYRELGSMGERVLAFCDMDLYGFQPGHKFDLDEGSDFVIEDLRFLGLVAMIDPPRGTVPAAVRKCKDAGIHVIMVTGDHPITAQAIAKQVGIITASHRRSTQISLPTIDKKLNKAKQWNSIVVPGDELARLADPDLCQILMDFNEIVFARTSPQQKLRIVESFQSLGAIVAVTGDGVNDSPALKKADIGVAMGITGSDVSKQAADMILMDDDFASIVIGVEEGRKIFDNLKKTISYAVAGSVSTLYPFMVFLVFGFPVTITSLVILCICLGTDMMPAISLSYEKAECDIMTLQPRNPAKDFLVTRNLILWSYFQGGFIVTASGYMGFFVAMAQHGWMPWQMWQLRNGWDADVIMEDWYGQEVTQPQREAILSIGQTAYFVSVVVCQMMDVLCNKTRRVSLFVHGFGNWFTNFAILFEAGLCCLIVYTPYLNSALTTVPVSGWAWCTGAPFAVYLLAYEELRKFTVRTWPSSWIGIELAR